MLNSTNIRTGNAFYRTGWQQLVPVWQGSKHRYLLALSWALLAYSSYKLQQKDLKPHPLGLCIYNIAPKYELRFIQMCALEFCMIRLHYWMDDAWRLSSKNWIELLGMREFFLLKSPHELLWVISLFVCLNNEICWTSTLLTDSESVAHLVIDQFS